MSLISRVTYDRLKTRKALRKPDLIISQAHGEEVVVSNMTWLSLSVRGVEENHKPYVAPGLCNELILGENWLKQNTEQLTFRSTPMLSVGGVELFWGGGRER